MIVGNEEDRTVAMMVATMVDRGTALRALIRATALAATLLAAAPGLAQAGYTGVFGFTPPPASSSQGASRDDQIDPDDITKPSKTGVPGLPGAPGTAAGKASQQIDIPFDLLQAIRRLRNPPAGTFLSYNKLPSRRLGHRLGASMVLPSAAGARLGGGYNAPSREAVTTDPRDAFERYVTQISDPKTASGN